MLLFSHFEFTFALMLYTIVIIFFSSIVTPIIVKIINENLIGKFISRLIHHK
jgi:hypothetical protein